MTPTEPIGLPAAVELFSRTGAAPSSAESVVINVVTEPPITEPPLPVPTWDSCRNGSRTWTPTPPIGTHCSGRTWSDGGTSSQLPHAGERMRYDPRLLAKGRWTNLNSRSPSRELASTSAPW